MTREEAELAVDRNYADAIRDAIYGKDWNEQAPIIAAWLTKMRIERGRVRHTGKPLSGRDTCTDCWETDGMSCQPTMPVGTRVRLLRDWHDDRGGVVLGPGQLPGEVLVLFDDDIVQKWHIKEKWLEIDYTPRENE